MLHFFWGGIMKPGRRTKRGLNQRYFFTSLLAVLVWLLALLVAFELFILKTPDPFAKEIKIYSENSREVPEIALLVIPNGKIAALKTLPRFHPLFGPFSPF